MNHGRTLISRCKFKINVLFLLSVFSLSLSLSIYLVCLCICFLNYDFLFSNLCLLSFSIRIKGFYLDALAAVREISPNLPVLLHDSFRGLDWGGLMKDWPYLEVNYWSQFVS